MFNAAKNFEQTNSGDVPGTLSHASREAR
jgi:hypothetical protein